VVFAQRHEIVLQGVIPDDVTDDQGEKEGSRDDQGWSE
jgi:hypothetical protein